MQIVMLLGLRLNHSWKNTRGQDLIEYALMAGFVAIFAGVIMPGVANSIGAIFSQITSLMAGPAPKAGKLSVKPGLASTPLVHLWRELQLAASASAGVL
jgi:pilus assembly protein Flp/PilA